MTREFDPDNPEEWDEFTVRKQLALGRISEDQARELGYDVEGPTPPDPRPGVAGGNARESLGQFQQEDTQYEDNYDSVNKDALVEELTSRENLEGMWNPSMTKAQMIEVLRADDAQSAASEG